MLPLIVLNRLGMFALTLVACAWMTHRLGAGNAILAWGAIMVGVCGSVALLMRRAPVGQISFAGRLAGIFLPYGYILGRGKLLPIVLTSWTVWMLLGSAVAICVTSGYDPRTVSTDGQRHITRWLVMLLLSWILDGWAALYLLKSMILRWQSGSPPVRAIVLLMAALLAMIAGSGILWWLGQSKAAVLLAGGPPLLVGVPYGLFVLMIVIAKPRWN